MSVSGINTVGSPTLRPIGPMPTDRTNAADAGSNVSPLSAGSDAVEISSAGRMMSDPDVSGDMRSERLARIRAAIDDGTYETAEKLDIALSRMVGAMWGDDD